MALKIYNTGSKKVEQFTPANIDNVTMYVCGPTVYAQPHVGNARPLIVFDVLYRLLMHIYGMQYVTYARNITDIDDKIINKAKELDCTIQEVTAKSIADFERIQQALNIIEPNYQPKATEYIDNMCSIIKKLLEDDYAYINNTGDVLFDTSKYKDYYFFQPADNSQSGHRHIKTDDKKNEHDFVLWKNVSDEDANKYKYAWATPEYMSLTPGKVGRPGWHIECTAMSTTLFGEKFDIHGGGSDLISPHHQNERAQTCAFTKGDDCANYWMHNGMIQMSEGKMSKSLGNVLYLDDVCQTVHALSVRFYMLQTHYRHPLLWNVNNLQSTHNHYTRLIKNIYMYLQQHGQLTHLACQEILDAIENDINTPQVLSIIEQKMSENKYHSVLYGLNLLGLLPNSTEYIEELDYTQVKQDCLRWLQRIKLTDKQQLLMQQRWYYKANKEYEQADIIRKELLDHGIQIEDSADGYFWYCV